MSRAAKLAKVVEGHAPTDVSRAVRLEVIRTRNTATRKVARGLYVVRVTIDHQSFTVDTQGGTTKGRAEFYRRALAVALNRFRYGD